MSRALTWSRCGHYRRALRSWTASSDDLLGASAYLDAGAWVILDELGRKQMASSRAGLRYWAGCRSPWWPVVRQYAAQGGRLAATAIIIAAHDEESVIRRCLDTIRHTAVDGEFEVFVGSNGCTDGTVAPAESRKVQVIELADSGKSRALNIADAAASCFPRLYLDADMMLSADYIRILSKSLDNGTGFFASAPNRKMDVSNRPLAVRAFFLVQQGLPFYKNGLVGRGAVTVSETGRARFAQFPDETADDLFLDSLFGPNERTIVDSVTCIIEAPHTRQYSAPAGRSDNFVY
jgi:hypothetical protein